MPHSGSHYDVNVGDNTIRYKVVSSMLALGGVLCVDDPNKLLIRHRLNKGISANYMDKGAYKSKQPLSVKLGAFREKPRATAT